ncbi:MAG TPA: permease prefix domain 1-containing protein [Actinomycetota bacterium]|nr:permease prefix domain 1-containing protein [Actinomycetota bacterium]
MARAAGVGTIDSFVSKLEPNLVGHARLRRRLVEEMRGHLEDAAERHQARGLTPDEAQQRAIDDFGSPETVVGAWAESKGVGVPTTFTRYAGLAGFVGALGLGVSTILEQMSVSYSHGAFAEVSMFFVALFTVSLVALYMRVRGKLVPFGRLGPRISIAGFFIVLVSMRFWFGPGTLVGMIAIVAGLGAFFIGTIRSGVVPRGPVALWIGGLLMSFTVGLGSVLIDVDAGALIPLIGLTALMVGWAWLGLHLWAEKATDHSDRDLVVG